MNIVTVVKKKKKACSRKQSATAQLMPVFCLIPPDYVFTGQRMNRERTTNGPSVYNEVVESNIYFNFFHFRGKDGIY